ncbi:MAG TPA: DUF72 domain-containing protein [Bryobacteraceae bacterium]|nr:DUF72 domain-containing protein [Bryobacteraceae bacterium]
MGQVQVGTSGWHYKHWIGPFYPKGTPASRMLGFYAERFDIVELNNTFYRLPPEHAVEAWREESPRGFKFAVKGSRFITHMKKLKDPALALERFFERADLLRSKLGPIVFQLPPHWGVNVNRFGEFLLALPRGHRYAFEFRDPSWNHPQILRLMKKFRAAYCIFELAGAQSPLEITADFTYIRLHGPGGAYQGSYNDASLRAWARRIREWGLKHAYVFFDNDQSGYAAMNALRLKDLL